MVEINGIHYAATMLHPKYRHLKMCSTKEKQQCKTFIRNQMKKISAQERTTDAAILASRASTADEPPTKRKRFGEEFETGNLSDEFEDDGDELERYLSKHLGKGDSTDNLLDF